MENFKTIQTEFEGLSIIERGAFQDSRGIFEKIFSFRDLSSIINNFSIEQINLSKNTSKGTLRGLHYQLKPYEEYTSRAKRQVALLKTIVPNVQDVDKLEGESMQRDFIEAFKALVKTLTTLRNFIEFEFNEAEVGMSEQDYMDYKSKYLDLNRQVNQLDKVSILADISFDIELLSTDIINVDYIIMLPCKRLDYETKQKLYAR
jgi:hypothetical protein